MNKIFSKIKGKINSIYYARHKNIIRLYTAKKDNIDFFKSDNSVKFYIIDNIEDYKKFTKNYDVISDANEKKLFLKQFQFCAVVKNGVCGCTGWCATSGKQFTIKEIDATCKIPNNSIVLFDFFTKPSERRKGLYSELLRRIVQSLNCKYFFIYTMDSNIASFRAIEKCGFKFVGEFCKKTFKGFKSIILNNTI